MQRKNYILNTSHLKKPYAKKRKAFAMMMAISVLVLVATIMALSLSITSQTTKRTTDLYLYEQAVLLSKSATEYALLQISQNPNACIDNGDDSFNFKLDFNGNGDDSDDIYDINITTRYIGTSASGCSDYISNMSTPELDGSVLMDVTISIDDPTVTTEPIRYFRRTIQKL